MGTFSRMRCVISANVNSLLEKAEDPEKLLRSLIHEMEDAAEDARLASADLLAEQSRLARVQERCKQEISEWTEKAEKAVETKRDELALAALKSRAGLEQTLKSTQLESASLEDSITQLGFDMASLKSKLAEAKLRLKTLCSRNHQGAPGSPVDRARSLSPGARRMRRAMGRFERLQAQVELLEARVDSYEFGGTAENVWQAEHIPIDPAIEAELEKMKNRISPA